MKYLVIGDIHGCYDELMALLDKAGLNSEDKIIALGDILDRGPDSAKVLNFITSRDQASSLMGNHEHKHLLINGGTIRPSLSQKITCKQFSSEEYGHLIKSIKQFPYCIDMEAATLVHGSFEPGVSVTDQKQTVLLGTRNGEAYLKNKYDKPWHELYNQEKPIIAGHRDLSGKGEVQVINDKIFFMDTGCCYGKSLSAVLLPDFKIFQVKSSKNYWGIIKQQAIQEAQHASSLPTHKKNILKNILKTKEIIREDEPCDLIEALGDIEPHIRLSAAQALAQKGDSRWMEFIKGDDVDIIRLGDCDLPQALPPLIYAMGWREIIFREGAITLAGHIYVPNAIEKLEQALDHQNCRIRRGAAEALGYRYEPQAVKVLIDALFHFDPDVVTNAADSLRAFNDPLIKPALEDLWVRCPDGVDMAVVKATYSHLYKSK